MEGWIKLHRNVTQNKVFQNALLFKLFIYCLCRAGHEERDWRDNRHLNTIHLMPGEFISSYRIIAQDMGCSRSAAVRWIKQLETDGCITAVGNTHYTRFSVVNWALYQSDDENVGHTEDNRQNATKTKGEKQTDNRRTQTIMYKNDKNEKEEKNWASPFSGDFMG